MTVTFSPLQYRGFVLLAFAEKYIRYSTSTVHVSKYLDLAEFSSDSWRPSYPCKFLPDTIQTLAISGPGDGRRLGDGSRLVPMEASGSSLDVLDLLDWHLIFNTLNTFVRWQSIAQRTMSDSLSWLSPQPYRNMVLAGRLGEEGLGSGMQSRKYTWEVLSSSRGWFRQTSENQSSGHVCFASQTAPHPLVP